MATSPGGSKVAAELAGRPFEVVQVDISPRAHELDATDLVPLPNSLDFAGIVAPLVEIVDVHRHAAEKFHAMLRDYGDRENTRVRDLVDLMILAEHELPSNPLRLLRPSGWSGQSATACVLQLGSRSLPASWPAAMSGSSPNITSKPKSFAAAVSTVAAMWAEMFPTEET